MSGLKKLNTDGAIDQKLIEINDSYVGAFGMLAYAHGQTSLFLSGRAEVDRKKFIAVYRNLMGSYIHSL